MKGWLIRWIAVCSVLVAAVAVWAVFLGDVPRGEREIAILLAWILLLLSVLAWHKGATG